MVSYLVIKIPLASTFCPRRRFNETPANQKKIVRSSSESGELFSLLCCFLSLSRTVVVATIASTHRDNVMVSIHLMLSTLSYVPRFGGVVDPRCPANFALGSRARL